MAIVLCATFAVYTAIVPFARAFHCLEINYNEGWNVYNAVAVADHKLLYAAPYGWTSVNYPMLSFAAMAVLHRFTHEYLVTARCVSLLSLLLCCVLVAAVVRRLGTGWYAAGLAGLFVLPVFCTDAAGYVGMDDPQMFAQVLFLCGLLVYVSRRGQSRWALVGAAALFVLGGSIKHNLIDFPLAVLLDLFLVSLAEALLFAIAGLVFAVVSLGLNYVYGGPYVMVQLLAPRDFSSAKAMSQLLIVLGPVLLPLVVAAWAGWATRYDPRRRIAGILLGVTVLIGGYFGGGHGVSINALFSSLLAMTILVGIAIESTARRFEQSVVHRPVQPTSAKLALLLFVWLFIPLFLRGDLEPVRSMHRLSTEERRFEQQVAWMRASPGPALCESLLRCYLAEKPYVYDPFNATRLIRIGKLNPEPLMDSIRSHRFGVIQLDGHIAGEADLERFDPRVLAMIGQEYRPVFQDEDVTLYTPKER